MRIRRKTKHCLNCGHTLGEMYNYCPMCGQENNDNNISFWKLVKDFFSNYFALDSKLAHSLKPFFLKPGYLTNRYKEGKRASFVNPVRFYLILSLFYFFIFAKVNKANLMQDDQTPPPTAADSTQVQKKQKLSEAQKAQLQEVMNDKEIAHLDSVLQNNNVADSVPAIHLGDKKDNVFFDVDWSKFDRIQKNNNISLESAADSLLLKPDRGIKRRFVKQLVKAARLPQDILIGYFFQNIPIMMFFLLPIFALILKLLYLRRDQLYIHHVIHTIHLHCFAYLMYGIGLILMWYILPDVGNLRAWVGFLFFLLVSFYAYVSFRRVYHQGRFKTLIKFMLLGGIYSLTLLAALIIEAGISFFLF